ncbi:MAG: hypothetical protein FJ090_00125 [Deltaproteobacteria bacterium]|nr:hypothetical protein [Deltaproteobacteria bacterium]
MLPHVATTRAHLLARATEAWRFGSPATGDFDERSDCDLGICWPTAADYARALGVACAASACLDAALDRLEAFPGDSE